MSEHFKVFLLSQQFYAVCDWSVHKIPIRDKRPGLLLTIEDAQYPNSLCCIPISKDDDKNDKYKKILRGKPDLVHPVDINQYDNYLLIQNMFYIRREFVGDPFIVNGIQAEITRDAVKKEILRKVRKVDALINQGRLSFVPRGLVYKIQEEFLTAET